MVSTRPSRVKGQLSRSASKRSKAVESLLSPHRSLTKAKHKDAGKVKAPAKPKPSEEVNPPPPKSKTNKNKARVWWPPTKDKRKTNYAGAYWPATILHKLGDKYEVRYDNGETTTEPADNVTPDDVPTGFGKEDRPLMVGEFCEVSNNSKTDPGVWLGRVSGLQSNKYVVDYPFHDAEPEVVEKHLIRRARVWENKQWRYIQPNQEWSEGEVTHPAELVLLPERDFFKLLSEEEAKSPKEESEQQTAEQSEEESEEPPPPPKVADQDTVGTKKATAKTKDAGKKTVATKEKANKTESQKDAAASTSGKRPAAAAKAAPTAKAAKTTAKLAETKAPPKAKGKKSAKVDDKGAASDAKPAAAAQPGAPGPSASTLPMGYQLLPVPSLPMLSGSLPAGTQLLQLQPGGTMPQFSVTGPATVARDVALASGSSAGGLQVTSGKPEDATAMDQYRMLTMLGQAYGLASGQMLPGGLLPFPLPGVRIPPPSTVALGDAAPVPSAAAAAPAPALASASEDSEVKKTRKKRDKDAPKKPASSYIVFLAKHRQALMESNPSLLAKDITSVLAKMWREATPEERDLCEQEAKKDRARFEEEMKSYVTQPQEQKEQQAAAAAAPKKKKKEATAAAVPTADAAPSNTPPAEPAATPDGKASHGGKKKKPKLEKEEAEGKATEEAAEVEGQKPGGQQKEGKGGKGRVKADPGTEGPEGSPNRKKRRGPKLVPGENAPPKRARTAYILFSQVYRKTLDSSQVSFDAATKLTAGAWRKLSEEERKKWDELAEQEKERHEKQLKEFNEKQVKAEAPAAQSAEAEELQPHMSSGPQQLVLFHQGLAGMNAMAGLMQQQQQQMQHQHQQMNESQEVQRILNSGMDMKKARNHIIKLFGSEAYMMLLDVWRQGSQQVNDAIRSFKAHLQNQLRPDWRAFMVAIFGLERMNELARKHAAEDKKDLEVQPSVDLDALTALATKTSVPAPVPAPAAAAPAAVPTEAAATDADATQSAATTEAAAPPADAAAIDGPAPGAAATSLEPASVPATVVQATAEAARPSEGAAAPAVAAVPDLESTAVLATVVQGAATAAPSEAAAAAPAAAAASTSQAAAPAGGDDVVLPFLV